MNLVTLAELKRRARERADMENSDFIGDEELTTYVQKSAQELYDLLIKSSEDYAISTSSIALVASQDAYDLPEDFYKLLGVDVQLSNSKWRPLKKFMFAERNNGSWGNLTSLRVAGPRYRLRGNSLVLSPIPTSSLQARIWYAPLMPALAADDDTFQDQNGFDEYIVVDAAIKMKSKEESDVSELLVAKKALKERIEAMAANRDQGAASRIVDTDEDDGSFGWWEP